ncbi:MAG: carbohydrate kinase family protein [Candidatus Heimdallarchaeota archaeon]|nr:MAG: carbohydrate kinase family protein [Candidatus Heimdallarchaeota archaeon]
MDNQKEAYCLGHISVDIFIDRLALNNFRLGGCIDSSNLTIHGGGDVANVSFWLGKLKTPVSMIGIIGDDPAGSFVKNELENMNVECHLKVSKELSTATILIIIEPDGERSFIVNRESQNTLEWEDLPLSDILKGDLFYTSGYTIQNQPIKDVIFKLFESIKENRASTALTMFNLAAYTTVERFKPEIKAKILPYSDILVGNKEEFEVLISNPNDKTKPDIHEFGNIICEFFPEIQVVLITDGGNGCYYSTQKKYGHIPANQVRTVDTTGAGDGFCAGFISSYLEGTNLEEAIKRGTRLGSHICQGYGARFGAATLTQ